MRIASSAGPDCTRSKLVRGGASTFAGKGHLQHVSYSWHRSSRLATIGTVRIKNGYPLPDARCSPSAINPAITLEVLKDPGFRTGCVRDCTTTSSQKANTYGTYGIAHPVRNNGKTQTCELDHVVPLELGGADSLDNIWPQCGPTGAPLPQRFYKEKDVVENYPAGPAGGHFSLHKKALRPTGRNTWNRRRLNADRRNVSTKGRSICTS
jgi:hypothetical protein